MTVECLFWRLGIRIGSIGYQRALAAVKWVLENEDRLSELIAYVYYPVGQQCGCSWQAVERNLRTVIARAYKQNKPLLEQLAGYLLERPPRAGDFLGMVYTCMARQGTTV